MIVTIDGPAGSGKSTVARKLASKLGFIHLNSGALFRAVAWKANQQGVRLDDEEEIVQIAAESQFSFKLIDSDSSEGRHTLLLVDDQDLSQKINSEEAGALASRVAVLPKLRKILLLVQRQAAEGNSVVLEGRDAGTVVFPEAEVKFYLDASPEVRAARRWLDLQKMDKGGDISVEDVKRDILLRDQRELTREHAPLRQAEGAIFIDTSKLSIEEVVAKMSRVVVDQLEAVR